jgi:hypothetical protein
MRLALCLSLLLASSAWAADEAADRASIQKVISTLNTSPDSPGLFTDDFGDNNALVALSIYRSGVPVIAPETAPDPSTIHVGSECVSHKPMGELGPCRVPAMPAMPATNSRFVIQSVRLLTPNVALVDSTNYRDIAGMSHQTPVLLVLRKEADIWKIASLRILAPTR